MPVLFNGLIVGPVVYFAYELAPGAAVEMGALWTTVATVALGEAVVCMVLGRLLYAALDEGSGKAVGINEKRSGAARRLFCA